MVRGLAGGQGVWSRALRVWLSVALVAGLLGYDAVSPAPSVAAPALSVTTTVGSPLLGGTSTIQITATNTGDTKGYNLSFDALIASGMADPNGRVRIVDSTVAPTASSLDAATGDTSAAFFDLVDLAPGESYSLTIEVDIADDATWEVNELLTVLANGRLNEIPDNSGTWLTGSDSASAPVIPIDLVRKSANQTTGVHQATGTETRDYSYSLLIQNNHVNASRSVVVTDTLPDGVEFLGVTGGPALDIGYPQRDSATGVTLLQWSLGDMAPGAQQAITYTTGIRYDYFGTDNGGTNRAHDDFTSSQPATAAIVPNKTTFTNDAGLTSEYRGSLPDTITPTDAESESVTGAYVTVDKAGAPATGGHGTVIDYTLEYHTSQYYAADTLELRDTLPDGTTYVDGSAVPAPTSVAPQPDGTTLIVWSGLPALGTTDSGTVTFSATVDTTWERPEFAGEPVRAGDSMTNVAEMSAVWYDQVAPGRSEEDLLVATVSAALETGLPEISKQVWNPVTSSWAETMSAQVGDELLYRVRFNTDDGVTPLRSNVALGNITLTDWLPPGTVYNGDAAPSYDASFSVPGTGTPPALNPDTPNSVSIGSLSGLEWFLGDVSPDGWWETTFTVTVTDQPVVQEGLKTGNHWKLTGINTLGSEYSDRDIAPLDYVDPDLVLTKDVESTPDPLVPGSTVGYSVTIDNAGLGAAEDVVITDTLPVGMRSSTPSITAMSLDGTPLVAGSDYTSAYNALTGVWTIDLHTAGVDTPLPGGSSLVVEYDSVVDSGVGAGATLTDIATVAYNTQADGSGRAVAATSNISDPNTDDATVELAPLTVTKNWPTGPYTVGQTFTASIDVDVPQGMVAYLPRIVDTFNRDGAYYVPGSATLTTLSGTPATAASFAATSTPTRGNTTTNNSTTLTWDLASPVDNTGQAAPYRFRLEWDLRYTGVRDNGTIEFFPAGANDRITNTSAVASWATTSTGSRDRSATYNPPNVYTNIDQPRLTLDKTTSTSGPYAGDSTIGYQVVIANTGWSTAYDLDWSDVLPAHLGSPSLTSITHSSLGSIVSTVTSDFSAAPNLSVDFEAVSLAPGQSITISYAATVDSDVPADAVLTNNSDVDWSSLPGTPAGSRRYDDQSWESGWTADTDAVTVNVTSPTLGKAIVGPNPARIGDDVVYRLRVTVPAETVLPGSYLSDTIAAAGSQYVEGSASTQLVSGSPETSATVATVVFDDTPNPGATLRFELIAPVDNSSAAATTGDTPYVFDLFYTLKVDGLTDSGGWAMFPPAANDTIGDTGRLHWTVGAADRSIGSAASLDVDQPLLTLGKSETSTGPYEGGDTVSYRTVITNTGWATAYDLTWDDVFAPDLSAASLVGVSHSVLGDVTGSVVSDFSNGASATVDFQALTLAPGQTLTVDYEAVVDPGSGSGSMQLNTADVDWTSQPGLVPGERVFNDSVNEAAWTADTDTATVQIAQVGLEKVVVGGDVTRTIGEEFAYDVSFSVPTSTTAYNVSVADLVPDGLTVLSATGSAPVGTVLVGPESGGQTPVVWSLGTLANPPYTTLTLTLNVRVDDTFAGGGALDGLPVGVDGDPQTVITNAAGLSWDDALVGGVTRTSTDDVAITIEEPHLTIDKVSSRATLGATDVATYTVTIDNDGTSTAHAVRFDDTLPSELFAAGTSPTLVGVEVDDAPLVAGTEYLASFGAAAQATVDLLVPVPAGSSVTIIYAARLAGGVLDGTLLTNNARVSEYRSLPATATGERVSGPVTDSVTLTATAPRVMLDKSLVGDAQLQAGQQARFRLAITNIGNARGYSAVATDTLPAGLTYVPGSTSGTLPGIGAFSTDPVVSGSDLVWAFGGALELDPGQTATFDFLASVDSSAPLGLLTNSAEAVLTDAGGVPVIPSSDTQQVRVTDPKVAVAKSLASGQDPFVQVGEQVTFDILVSNTGSTTLQTIPLLDTFDAAYLDFQSATPMTPLVPVPGTLAWADVTGAGSLAPGAQTTISVTFDVVGHPPTSVTTNMVSAGPAIDQYGDATPSANASRSVGITAPAVSVDKRLASGQSATVSAGDTVTFDIGVTNSGDTTLAAVALGDTFDAGVFEFVSATPVADSSVPSGTVVWNDLTGTFGELAPSQTATVTVTLRGRTAAVDSLDTAEVTSAVDVHGDPALLDTDTAVATVVEPALSILKTADRVLVGPGETTTYGITLTNSGTGPAHDVVISDLVPAALWPITLDRVELDGSELVAGSDYVFATSALLEWEIVLLVPIPSGSQVEVVYTADLAGGTPAASVLENNVSATGTSLPGANPQENVYGPVTSSWTVTSQAPALSLLKTVVGDTELQAGQAATYRISVTNIGDAPAYSVAVTDTLPPGLTYVPGTTTAAWSGGGSSTAEPVIAGSVLSWGFSAGAYVLPGESLTLEYQAAVDDAASLGTKTNAAAAAGVDGGGWPLAQVAGEADLLVTLPGSSVSKQLAAGQDAHAQVGEQVTFDFVVRNSGDTTITTLPMADEFDSGFLSYINGSASVAPDTVSPGRIEWDDLTAALGDFEPGRVATITATFEAIAHPASSSTEDTVSVVGAVDVFGDPVPFVGDTGQVGITAPAVQISKVRTSPALTSPGETVSFDIIVANSGDTTLTVVPVTDDYDEAVLAFNSANVAPSVATVPGELEWDDITTSLGDIAPGTFVTLSVDFTAADTAALTTNTAAIAVGSAIDVNTDTAGGVNSADTVRVAPPSLSITKTADHTEMGPGDTAVYSVTIENTASVPAVGAVFTDEIPAYLGVPNNIVVAFDGVAAASGDLVIDTGDPFTIDFVREIDPGEVVTIDYELTLAGGTPGGQSLENTASVEWFSAGGVGYGPRVDTYSVDTLEPVLTIAKSVVGDTELQRGQEATYTITVGNIGDAPAYSFVVTDTLPAGLTYVDGSALVVEPDSSVHGSEPLSVGPDLVWGMPLGVLDPGQSLTITFRARVDADSDTGTKTNTARADARDGGGSLRGPVEATADLLVTDPSVDVVKRLVEGQDAHVQVGETVRFDIAVTNDGTTDIETLPLADAYDATYLQFVDATPIPDATAAGSLAWDDVTGAGFLAVGETTTVTVEFTAIAHPNNSSTTDTATVAGAVDQYGDPVGVVTDTDSISITQPSLRVRKVFSGTERSVYQLGTPISFDIGVENTGDTTITTLPLTDEFDPAVLRYVGAQPVADTVATNTVGWTDLTQHLGDLAPGETATVTVNFTAVGLGTSTNSARVADGTAIDQHADPVPGDADSLSFGIYESAQIGFSKTANPAPGTILLPGDTITYSLTLANTTDLAIPDVRITDVVPDSVTYQPGTMTIDRGQGTASSLTDESDSDEGVFDSSAGARGTVRVDLPEVPAETTVTVSFDVQVREAEYSRAGVRNYASATSAGDKIGTVGPVDHYVDPFDIVKSGRDVNGGRLVAGDRIEWQITVTNTGLVPTTNVVVRDTVPSQTRYVSGSIRGRGADDSDAPDLEWQVGTMQVGESVTLSFRSTVKSGLKRGTTIRNQAVVTADQSGPKYSDSPDTPEVGDPTLLQTGANDWIWIGGVLLLLFAAAMAWGFSRRLRRG